METKYDAVTNIGIMSASEFRKNIFKRLGILEMKIIKNKENEAYFFPRKKQVLEAAIRIMQKDLDHMREISPPKYPQ